MSTALQTNTKAKEAIQLIENQQSEFTKALGTQIPTQYFVRAALTAMRKNPLIYNCTPNSRMQCLMDLAQIRLVPDSITGEAYLIPFRNKGEYECQLMIGYQGYLKLLRSSNTVTNVYAAVVYEKDEFEISFGSNRRMVHKPKIGADRGKMIGAVAYVAYGGENASGEDFTFVQADYIDRVKRSARGTDSPASPWNLWPEPMWAKTALKQLCKTANLAPDVREKVSRAVDLDDAGIIDVQSSPSHEVQPAKSELTQEPEFQSSPPPEQPAPKKKAARRGKAKVAPEPQPNDPATKQEPDGSVFGDDEPPMGNEEPRVTQPTTMNEQPKDGLFD